MITQLELSRLKSLAERKLVLGKSFREIEKEEKELRTMLFERMKNKEEQQKGNYHATIVTGKRNPKWREEFVKRCGEEEAKKVIDNTPFSETVKIESIE